MSDAWTNAFLRRGRAACPACGMMLREVEAGRCGFCGSRISLGLALVPGYRTAWSVCTALLVAGAGFSSFVALLTLVWTPPGPRLPLLACCWSSVFFLAGSATVVMKRERFCALPSSTQRLLATLAGVALLALTATFMRFMR